MTAIFFHSIFIDICWDICRIGLKLYSGEDLLWIIFCLRCKWILSFRCISMDFRVVVLLKITFTLYGRYFLKFFTAARNTRNRNKNVFLYFHTSFRGLSWGWRCLFCFFGHPIWVVVFEKHYMDVIHFFGYYLRGGTFIFSFVD